VISTKGKTDGKGKFLSSRALRLCVWSNPWVMDGCTQDPGSRHICATISFYVLMSPVRSRDIILIDGDRPQFIFPGFLSHWARPWSRPECHAGPGSPDWDKPPVFHLANLASNIRNRRFSPSPSWIWGSDAVISSSRSRRSTIFLACSKASVNESVMFSASTKYAWPK